MTDLTPSSVSLTWSCSVPSSSFNVYVNGPGFDDMLFTVATTAITIPNLLQDGLYNVHVFASSDDPVGATADVTTPIDPPGPLSFSNVTSSGFAVSWGTADNALAGYYMVSIAPNGTTSSKRSEEEPQWTIVGNGIPASLSSFAVDNLEAGSTYLVKVQAGVAGESPEPTGSIGSVSTSPAAANVPAAATNNTALIVAIVVIVVVLLLVCLCILFLLARRRRRMSNEKRDDLFAKATTDLAATSTTSTHTGWITEPEAIYAVPAMELTRVGTSRRTGSHTAAMTATVTTIPDGIAFAGPTSSSTPGTTSRQSYNDKHGLPDTDPTMINTVTEVALPGFLQLDYVKELRVEKQLSKGGAGTIYSAVALSPELNRRNFGNSTVVVKTIQRNSSLDVSTNDVLFHQEVAIMYALSFHANVIRLLGYSDEPRAIVTPLYKTDLFRYLHKQSSDAAAPPRLASGLMLHLCTGIVSAVDTMHSMSIAHRDIKSVNVLLNEPEFGNYPHPVVCDFGLSRSGVNHFVELSLNIRGFSPRYAAPEVFARLYAPGGYTSSIEDDKASDIFSLGVTIWEIIGRRFPWVGHANDKVEELLRSGERLPRLQTQDVLEANLIALAEVCMSDDRHERPSSDRILVKLKSFAS